MPHAKTPATTLSPAKLRKQQIAYARTLYSAEFGLVDRSKAPYQ